MYDKADPRSALNTATAAARPAPTSFAGAEYGLFYKAPPEIDDATGRTWLTRGQNFIVAYTEAKPGAVFERRGQVDEYVVRYRTPPPPSPPRPAAGPRRRTATP